MARSRAGRLLVACTAAGGARTRPLCMVLGGWTPWMHLDFESREPLYRQVEVGITEAVREGSASLDERQIEEGMRRLAELWPGASAANGGGEVGRET